MPSILPLARKYCHAQPGDGESMRFCKQRIGGSIFILGTFDGPFAVVSSNAKPEFTKYTALGEDKQQGQPIAP